MFSKCALSTLVVSTLCALALAACDESAKGVRHLSAPDTPPVLKSLDGQTFEVHRRGVIYVAAYSDLFVMEGDFNRLFAVTLSVHNTDAEHRIIIESVGYFSTAGELIEAPVDEPHALGPMASANFFVPESDDRGGHGANFIVEWASEVPVHEPIVEAVMVNVSSGNAFAFSSRGVALGERR